MNATERGSLNAYITTTTVRSSSSSSDDTKPRLARAFWGEDIDL